MKGSILRPMKAQRQRSCTLGLCFCWHLLLGCTLQRCILSAGLSRRPASNSRSGGLLSPAAAEGFCSSAQVHDADLACLGEGSSASQAFFRHFARCSRASFACLSSPSIPNGASSALLPERVWAERRRTSLACFLASSAPDGVSSGLPREMTEASVPSLAEHSRAKSAGASLPSWAERF
jgi:hypothetical protein